MSECGDCEEDDMKPYNEKKGMKMDEEIMDEIVEVDAVPAMDVPSVVAAIESGSISVADMDAILAAIQAANAAKQAAVEVAEETAPALAPVPGLEAMKKRREERRARFKRMLASRTPRKGKARRGRRKTTTSLMSRKFARLQGENVSMRSDIDAMKQDKQRSAEVNFAMHRLDGRPLGADLKLRLVSFHKDHGSLAFSSYVDGLAQTTGVLPSDNGSADAFYGQTGAPEVAMKYQAMGTDAVDAATGFAREWKSLHEAGHTRMSEDRYVSINMAKSQTGN